MSNRMDDIRKGDAREHGRYSRATDGTGKTKTRAASHVCARHLTPTRATRQELARIGEQAAYIARRCPDARRQARYAKIARYLLRAARGGRQHGH